MMAESCFFSHLINRVTSHPSAGYRSRLRQGGSIILSDALKRSFDIANNSLGSIGVVVDPLDDDALAFYEKFGFILLPDSGKMFLPMADIAQLGL